MPRPFDEILALLPEHPNGLKLTMVGGSSNRIKVHSIGGDAKPVLEKGSGLSIWTALLTAAGLAGSKTTGTLTLADGEKICTIEIHPPVGAREKPWIELQLLKE